MDRCSHAFILILRPQRSKHRLIIYRWHVLAVQVAASGGPPLETRATPRSSARRSDCELQQESCCRTRLLLHQACGSRSHLIVVVDGCLCMTTCAMAN